VTNPLERLKMLKQVKVPEYMGLSVWRSFVFMWQKEGFKGFLKGNGVNVVRIAPFSAFEMFFYDFYKYNLFGGQAATPTTKLICGGLTGMTASTLTYPLDLVRTVLSIRVDGVEGKTPSIMGCT
jgi:solute carrier family 25 (mitochondrial phosphate transporter), member 23/24/25/41